MPPALPRGLLAAALLAAAAGPAAADAVSDKQKAAALANMKKAEVASPVVAETDNLIVVAAVPEPKVKAMAAALDKVYALARKTLKYGDGDKPFTGKLTVYYLPDRQYKQFMRGVVGERAGDNAHYALKGDEPFVAVSPELPEKPTDADVNGEVGAVVAAALLAKKAPTADFPEWVRAGFGRVTAMRAEGPQSRRYLAYKTQARTLVLGGKGRPSAPIGDVWGGRTKESETLAVSLIDYLAYGPGAAKLESFLNGFKPSESVPMPGIPNALEAAGWKEPQLEAAWKKWVVTGK
jgi:hypothetical protein